MYNEITINFICYIAKGYMAKGNAEGLEALPVGTEADCCFETKYNDALVKTMRNFDLERQNDSSNAEEDYNIAVL